MLLMSRNNYSVYMENEFEEFEDTKGVIGIGKGQTTQ
jgi:hypothetical protein